MGPKFALPLCNADIPIPTIIKDLEYCVQTCLNNDDERNSLRAQCINSITNYVSKSKNIRVNNSNQILKDFKTCKLFLKAHPELIVMRSDKGNTTVIMNRTEYINGMYDLLADCRTYKILMNDPTTKFQNKANKLCKKLLSLKFINEYQHRQLNRNNSVFPKLYGLRKTHKPTLSLRPVVSCIDSPSYNLAVFVHEILSPFTTTFYYNIKNSFEFAESIKDIVLPKDYVLVSLDVTSLFTNVPKELVISVIKKNWGSIKAYTSLSREMLCEIVEFLFESSYFAFEGKFYQQLDGSAMGNPASPVLANLIMNDLITRILNKLPFLLTFLKLYVDDTILACPKNKIDLLLNFFNGYHDKLKFTIEQENNNSIPFLDMLVIRNPDGTLNTNWYLKPTASGRVINYASMHASTQKIATIKNLLFRAYHLSSPIYHEENEQKIKTILKKNNYPTTLVNRVITQFKSKLQCPNNLKDPKSNIYFKFPYIRGLSDKLGLHITKMNPAVKLAFYNTKTTSSLYTKLKQLTPIDLSSNLIYKIPCLNCDRCYVGQTKQYLKKRIYQHQYDCRPINASKKEITALANHHFNEHHNFDFSHVTILDKESHYSKRNISEMVHITLNKTVNCRTDTQGLSIQYNYLLNQFKGLPSS